MASTRTSQQRDHQQDPQRSNVTHGSPNGGEARQGGGVQGTDRERTIRSAPDVGSQRTMGSGRSSSIAPVYGSSAAASPFGLMRRMAEDMDRIFEDFGFAGPSFAMSPLLSPALQRSAGGMTSPQAHPWTPALETFRRGDTLVVRADLPGLRKEDVEVEIDDGVLTISGERTEEKVENRDDYYRTERRYGRFHRALALPEGVTGESCDATFKDGVLEVTLPMPKKSERKARQIAIK